MMMMTSQCIYAVTNIFKYVKKIYLTLRWDPKSESGIKSNERGTEHEPHHWLEFCVIPRTGAAEYTDCISAVE